MPGEVHIGQRGRVVLFIANRGAEAVPMVAVWFRGSFFDRFTLRDSSARSMESEPANGDGKLFEFGPLGPHEERPVTFDVTANAACPYDLTLTVFANTLYEESVGTYTGRSVVLSAP